ncbi:polar-differentiation response regulator DivK [mine drainage metagenome]|uniref:histidine kinase n=1 Tax=mine drainage metagenome TaxID=410659 RepID=A0A1J5PXI6_9ZZZZ
MGVTSTVGVGSVFWFELNLAQGESANTLSTVSVKPPEEQPVVPVPVPRSVLYVEDNPDNMALIEQLLAARAGFNLLGAQDAMRGIAMARSYQPDVIMMDINLPGISGIEALKILQADVSTAHIPVLALSANAMPHDIAKGLAAGFYAYLTKPIKVNELMTALDQGLAMAAQSLCNK